MKQWYEIDGYFSNEDAQAYASICYNMPNKARFLEIGAYKGRSTVLMDSLAKNMGKDIAIDIVDCFGGDEHMGEHDTYAEFLNNTQGCNIGTVYIGYSNEQYKRLEGKYDAIFIDACHNTPEVLEDIANYTPFLADGGIIAGHDIHFFGVRPAVEQVFSSSYTIIGNCWIVKT